MIPYAPPLEELRFVLGRLIGLDRLSSLPDFESVNDELADAILSEAGRLASDVFAPLNFSGDQEGAHLVNGQVTMPKGCREAYQAFVEGGWNGLAVDAEHGGQGLPAVLGMAVQEMLQSANLGLALCTLLNQGAVELIASHGAENLRTLYLPKMVSGAWSGTMNLTEPQAGSDVGAVKCRAVSNGDGTYKLIGQKIFISYGDHDLAENIIHLVLARLPDAPEGTKGLSLFLVPKFMVNQDGSLGAQNDVHAVSLEHKLGQHASPTCVMAYGDKTGAIGYLVGQENGGIAAMFTMMNNARIGVGVQGLALMERSTQQAIEFARTRVQSRDIAKPSAPPVAIIQHPDVKRMLMLMKAQTESARALAYDCALHNDLSRKSLSEAERQASRVRVDILTPLVKSWLTDLANEVTSIGVQVHGGMGYIEETGAAQHMRDARVLAIYEGTNGIQGNDLVFRKIARDGGAGLMLLLNEVEALLPLLAEQKGDDCSVIAESLRAALADVHQATEFVLSKAKTDVAAAAAIASPYLRLVATMLGGYYMARSALVAQTALMQRQDDPAFMTQKIATARFYAEHVIPLTKSLKVTVLQGASSVISSF